MLPFNILAPSVESKNSKQPLFLESDPLSLITNGEFHRVPWIYGFTEDEGAQLSTSSKFKYVHAYFWLTMYETNTFCIFSNNE